MVRKNQKQIAIWLLIGVVMVAIQFLLGGITRLTGSGLSITEWKPVSGIIPPLTSAEWQLLFEKYKQSAQFQYLNNDFSLSDFKFIFFWEWFHRFWARLMAFVFIIPFIYFIVQGSFTREAFVPFIGLFILGIFQGVVGWIMVQSGLHDSTLYVGHLELAVHFITAICLMVYLYLMYLEVRNQSIRLLVNSQIGKWAMIFFFLLIIQLFFGALMAGIKGATVAPTWPTINGEYFPWQSDKSLFQFLVLSPIGIHLMHRMTAYLILTLSMIMIITSQRNYQFYMMRPFIILVIVQILLGIFTVLLSPYAVPRAFGSFEWIALCHQTVGLSLILSVLKPLKYYMSPNK